MTLFAKKSLGQHFLNSKHVLDQIISAAAIKNGEQVLEIGPGTGILTEALLKAGAKVTAIEKDDRAYELLKEKFAAEISAGKLDLTHGDILETDLHASYSVLRTPFCVVANIPYYITGAILEKFLEHEPRPTRMVLLIQKEVADRIIARDGKESILSISVKAFGSPKLIAKVPPGAFTPPPSVDSAILSIENISDKNFRGEISENNKKDIDTKRFFEIVRAGFAHKRKFLKRNLESMENEQKQKEKLEQIWTQLGLDEKVRAEDLKLEQWFQISQKYLQEA